MQIFKLVGAAALAATVRAGWITFQNENKQKEGLPCVGSIYGNDNYLVSQFDCGATDFNSTFCGIHCFPFSPTACTGHVPDKESGNGLWYAPHSVQTACQFLGEIFSPGHDYPMAGENVTSCGYVDWPAERTWGPTRSVPKEGMRTKGCWDVSLKPDEKYERKNGIHYFDGAAPLDPAFCEQGMAEKCDGGHDKLCEYYPWNDSRIVCKNSTMPDTRKIK